MSISNNTENNTDFRTLSFILPYAIGLFCIRLVIDCIVKYSNWGYDGESLAGILSFVIEAIVIVLVVMKSSDLLGKKFNITQGIKVAIGLMAILGVLFSFYLFFIHGKFIDPEYQVGIIREGMIRIHPEDTVKIINTPNAELQQDSFIGFPLWILKYVFIGAFIGIPTSIISMNIQQSKKA